MQDRVIDLKPVNRAHEVRKQLRNVASQVRDDYIELAELLYEARTGEYHKEWGYASFHDYLNSELDVRPRRGDFLVSIAKSVKELGIGWDEISGIGWRKAGAIASSLNQDNYKELIEMAKENSLSQLSNKLKAKREDREEEPMKKMTLQLSEEEYSIVMAAIEEVMKLDGINGKSRAIVKMAYDGYMTNVE